MCLFWAQDVCVHRALHLAASLPGLHLAGALLSFWVCLKMLRPPPPSEDLLQVHDFLYRTILCSLPHFSALNTELGMAGGHLSWNQALEGRNLVNSPGSPEAR